MDIKPPKSKQPIPSHARKVFTGILFEVYQWEQEMFDGSRVIFEKLKRPDTVHVIPVTQEGKIILAAQEQPNTAPFVGVVGGRVDDGEGPLECAKRELLEETGFTSDVWELWYACQPYSKIEWSIYTFIARNCRKVKEMSLDSGERINLQLIDFNEFVKRVSHYDFRDTEIALEVLRAKEHPQEWAKLVALFAA